MANIFDGLITSDLQDIYNQGVDTLLNPDNAITVKCRLIYPSTSFSSGGTGPAVDYITGKPIPMVGFDNPAKDGENIVVDVNTEDVDLIVIWSPDKFSKNMLEKIAQEDKSADIFVQIMGPISLFPKIVQAQEFILNTENELFQQWKFVKEDEPEPLGLFDKRYFLCRLQRAG